MQSQFASSISRLSRFVQTRRRAVLNMAQPGTFDSQMKDGWFTELSTMWPGQGMSLKIDEVIFRGRSDFQVRAEFFKCAAVRAPAPFCINMRATLKHPPSTLINAISNKYIDKHTPNTFFCRMSLWSRLRLSAPSCCSTVLFSALTVMNSLTKKWSPIYPHHLLLYVIQVTLVVNLLLS